MKPGLRELQHQIETARIKPGTAPAKPTAKRPGPRELQARREREEMLAAERAEREG